MLARCPTCRETFSTDKTGQQACPACGKPLFVPEAPPVLAAPVATLGGPAGFPSLGGPAGPEIADLPGTPWERRPELPALSAWFETVKLALFEPGQLFARARLDRIGQQTSFAVITYGLFSVVGQLLSLGIGGPSQDKVLAQLHQLHGKLPDWLERYLEKSVQRSLAENLFIVALAPLAAFLFLWINAGVTHLCAIIFGQNRRGFAATFAACAYAMAPAVLCAVPACGSLVAVLWIIVLTGIGLKVTHGMSTGGATATTLGPYLFICCASCLLIVLLAGEAATALSGAVQ